MGATSSVLFLVHSFVGVLSVSAVIEQTLAIRGMEATARPTVRNAAYRFLWSLAAHGATVLLLGASIGAVYTSSAWLPYASTALFSVPGVTSLTTWLASKPLLSNLFAVSNDLFWQTIVPTSTYQAASTFGLFIVSSGFLVLVRDNLCPVEGNWGSWLCLTVMNHIITAHATVRGWWEWLTTWVIAATLRALLGDKAYNLIAGWSHVPGWLINIVGAEWGLTAWILMWTLLGSTILSFIFSGGTGKAYIDWLRGKRAKNAVHLTMGFIWLDNAWLVVRFLFFTWPYRICRWLLGGGARNLFFSGEDLKSTVEAFRVRDHQRHTDDELVTECNIAADQWVQMIADKEGMEVLTKAYPSRKLTSFCFWR